MRGDLNASTISRREGRRTGPVAARSALSAHQKEAPAWNDKGLPIKLYSAVSQTMRAPRAGQSRQPASRR